MGLNKGIICTECGLSFNLDLENFKRPLNSVEQLSCPYCQAQVREV